MSNYFHLLTRTGNLGLSTSMRLLQGDYARTFNQRHHRSGHLFQNRFGSALVGEDAYFLALVCYIHLNPLRAGMVAGLDALDSYPWNRACGAAGSPERTLAGYRLRPAAARSHRRASPRRVSHLCR